MTICQSCGMLIEDSEDYGTELDGSKSEEYCIHCYKKGKFTFDGNFSEFLEKQIDISTRILGLSPSEAEIDLKRKLPTLNRWKNEILEDEDEDLFED